MKVIELLEVVEQTPTQLVLRQQPGWGSIVMLLSWAFGFFGAPLLLVLNQEDKLWQIPLLFAVSFLGIIVFGILVFALKITTYTFEKTANVLTIKKQILFNISETQYFLNDIQAFGTEEYSCESYIDENGKVCSTAYQAFLQLPSQKIGIVYASDRSSLIYNSIIKSICGFLNLRLEHFE